MATLDDDSTAGSSSGNTGTDPEPTVIPRGHNDSDSPSTVEVDHTVLSSTEQVVYEPTSPDRAYQLEMLEVSLKQNIIVTMDTGSGKTRVAVRRIQAELERSPPGKIVWFLASTVALCSQQFSVLEKAIPAVQTKFISGDDGVDTWTNQTLWDAFLKDTSIVVSPHQVLLDALSHTFVRMEKLSLIVFDEAHNCVGRHPGSKVMAFYRDSKDAGLPIPAILGLTASPIMRSSLDYLEVIERTLDSVCKTPAMHKTELLSHVNHPSISCVKYGPQMDESYTPTMKSLDCVALGLDIFQDPYIIHLMVENTERSRIALAKALEKEDTNIFNQVRRLQRKSATVRRELGEWAVDFFLSTAVAQFLDSVGKEDATFATWPVKEKTYLASLLQKVETTVPSSPDDMKVSPKVAMLLEVLLSRQQDALGIVFVKETATVAVLARLLSVHPLTRDRFRVGSVCGTSRHAQRRRNVGELIRGDDDDLRDFRSGKINLLIATNVLEEGIDVPACNLVICFDEPANLKSFIQRRGRARMQKSNLVLLMDDPDSSRHTQWQELEQGMKRKYEDELREIKELDSLDDSNEESYVGPYYVPRTGAKLDMDQAKPHLEHFCAVLGSRQFVDWRPYYVMHKVWHPKSRLPQMKATVVLPISLPRELRRVDGENFWYSEKNASKDAAFQAYVSLHKAGLVNDYLLPLDDSELLEGVETRPPMAFFRPLWMPWPQVAQGWTEAGVDSLLYQRPIKVLDQGQILCEFDMVLPLAIPHIPAFNVYREKHSSWKVEFGELSRAATSKEDQTMRLIDLAYGHRIALKENDQHVVQFRSRSQAMDVDHLGNQQLTQELVTSFGSNFPYLIRDTFRNPYFFEDWLCSRPPLDLVQNFDKCLMEHPTDVPWLSLRKWSRRQDFLHPIPDNPGVISSKPYKRIWPASLCTIDTSDIRDLQFGSLIPSITHMVEIYLVASQLSATILKDLAITNIDAIVSAISSPAAREASNYERVEFLGDSILKLLATVNVAVIHPLFPEGYLSKKKDLIVSNSRLCRAAETTGLTQFILTTQFTGKKWRPLYIQDLLSEGSEEQTSSRQESTKVMADVVEALIGTCFLEGGMMKALHCIRVFIPEVKWYDLDTGRKVLASRSSKSTHLPDYLISLEKSIGHSFQNKKLLLEAVTHGSFSLGTSTDLCMERLEFLGDAILDNIVMSALWELKLSEQDMHLLRTALVNADLLGFLVMEWSIPQTTAHVIDGSVIESIKEKPMWKFMRFSSPEIVARQQATEKRHAEERKVILDALHHSPTYPWSLLAHLNIPKFFSDLFESVLGAVWMDSGSMDVCRGFVERAGILAYMRRMVDDKVDIMHPKNKLGELEATKVVKYEILRYPDTGDLACKVFIDDEFVVEVGGGVNKEEIKTKAAEAAYYKIRKS
ncbi:RNase3 domain-containing protein [Pseudomassariella vexata]|uniref:RNase3 domain-containing protein n=1 Tax=Pseudomassariella vexata TaxID=1141098 RepID=A0A1Y2DA88_9PEZI|nr:RNase3 domain-containing protein [Pseudomassariella vexata]ORY56117.1 RNase3 domain-containing protein [Pseudomassariella vexata]